MGEVIWWMGTLPHTTPQTVSSFETVPAQGMVGHMSASREFRRTVGRPGSSSSTNWLHDLMPVISSLDFSFLFFAKKTSSLQKKAGRTRYILCRALYKMTTAAPCSKSLQIRNWGQQSIQLSWGPF